MSRQAGRVVGVGTRWALARTGTVTGGILSMLVAVSWPSGVAAVQGSDLRVLSATAPATAAGASTAAVYVTVHNVGAIADRLVNATTPVADQVEIHRSTLDGAIMRMRLLPSLDLPVGGSIEMGGGGTHLMLIKLHHPLQAGSQFKLVLNFARAGAVTSEVSVQPLGSAAKSGRAGRAGAH